MAIKSQQLRQSFLISGAGAAVLLVGFVAWLTSNRVGRVLEEQADVRGRDVATRVAAIVTQYLKERRREVVSLAGQPQLIAAVREAYAQKRAEKELIKQYLFMARIFGRARRRLARPSPEKRAARLHLQQCFQPAKIRGDQSS